MDRKRVTKQLNPLYLILVEGYTEKIYFDALWEHAPKRGFTIKIKKPKHGNPTPLIREALRNHAEGGYNQIWCVYDCDVFLTEDTSSFEKLHQDAAKKNIKFAESMRSIEVWFLLHFMKPNKTYQTKEALIADLKKQIPTYEKTQKWLERNLYAQLQPNEQNAFANVVDFSTIDYKHPNTATTVNNLVEIFVKQE